MINFIRISNAAQEISNAAREANAIARLRNVGGALDSREQTIQEEFECLAQLLGFTVSKIEEDAPTDHVARFFRLPTDAIQAAE